MTSMPHKIKDVIERAKSAQVHYAQNLQSIEDILRAERGFVTESLIDKDVVVLCSGGLDSTIMLHKAIEDYNIKAYPFFVKRRSKAEPYEEEAFDFFVDFYSNRFPNNLGHATKLSCDVPPREFKQDFSWELAATIGHPLRNATLQNLVVMYAVALNGRYDLNIRTILIGSVGDDAQEPEQGLLSLRSQTLNTCINLADWSWQITSPLTDPYLAEKPVFKSDLITYALEKQIPLEKTRSCFSDSKTADGTCIACYKRITAFNALGKLDQTPYKNDKYIKVHHGKE